MNILHVNQIVGLGGAAGICLALHRASLAAGHQSAVLVGRRSREVPGVVTLDNDRFRPAWGRFWMATARRLSRHSSRIPGVYRLSEHWLPRMAAPARFRSWWAGREDFDFPGTGHLLEQGPFRPDMLHLHNLHGDYFDLRELPRLSRAVPTVVTLQDTWLLTGHCSYFFSCERWESGCGACPDLAVYPGVRRDATSFNWRRKREIYSNSQLVLVSPARWLADRVRESMLMPAATRLEVIPNGVDTAVFRPGSRAGARQRLGWSQEAFTVVFVGVAGRNSFYKDYATMREAIRLAANSDGARPMQFYVVGATAPREQVGAASIEFLSHRDSMAECYQAADVYLHAAKMDTFPLTVLEALASGVPVVATAAGGIPEQVVDGETGFVVPAGDAAAMAERLVRLSRSPAQTLAMGEAARRDAQERFSLELMVSRYRRLYQDAAGRLAGAHGD